MCMCVIITLLCFLWAVLVCKPRSQASPPGFPSRLPLQASPPGLPSGPPLQASPLGLPSRPPLQASPPGSPSKAPLLCFRGRFVCTATECTLFAAVSPPAQTVPFGVLCFLPSYKVLEKLTKRWQVRTCIALPYLTSNTVHS